MPKKSYLPTSLDVPPGSGVVELGHLLLDPFEPHPALSTISGSSTKQSDYPDIVTITVNERERSQSSNTEVSLGAWAKLLDVASAKLAGKQKDHLSTTYDMTSTVTEYYQKPPSQEVMRTRLQDPEVKEAIKARIWRLHRRPPIYMIVGIKIAKGLKYREHTSQEASIDIEAEGDVISPAGQVGLGASIANAKGRSEGDKWTAAGDIVVAYCLVTVKIKGDGDDMRVTQQRFAPKAAFLSAEEDSDDDEALDIESIDAFTVQETTLDDLRQDESGSQITVIDGELQDSDQLYLVQ